MLTASCTNSMPDFHHMTPPEPRAPTRTHPGGRRCMWRSSWERSNQQRTGMWWSGWWSWRWCRRQRGCKQWHLSQGMRGQHCVGEGGEWSTRGCQSVRAVCLPCLFAYLPNTSHAGQQAALHLQNRPCKHKQRPCFQTPCAKVTSCKSAHQRDYSSAFRPCLQMPCCPLRFFAG